jgi:hypothetical protein
MKLSGRNAIITGANRGFGFAVTKRAKGDLSTVKKTFEIFQIINNKCVFGVRP